MIICGIDPGTRITGYGVIEIMGQTSTSLRHVAHGAIRPGGDELPARLSAIFLELRSVFEAYHPAEVALETSFHYKNAATALKLGQARGVAILAASLLDIPVFEYAPTEIKKATCGYGQAGKDQVAAMVCTILNLPARSIPSPDASDALAVGVCHSSCRRMQRLVV